ncbi:PHD finger protein ALFIN-LIKE 6 [Abeliophyllum distichum]|uniref:PHD finger protein ALFIN-LIKE n=1 Tax=Abeliophyllum distichum TaxID=126358 RepID=A0ABD1NS97_9LAMI
MMENVYPTTVQRTVEDVFFNEVKIRRAGLIKAVTTDVDRFYQECDSKKKKLCLFGHPNGTWEVKPPTEMVPSNLPEPILGINFARDRMQEKEWLLQVAVSCDVWLLSIAFYYAAAYGFGKSERNRLFQMINHLPTIAEVVRRSNKQAKEVADATAHDNSSENISSGITMASNKEELTRSEEEVESDEPLATPCGVCGDIYVNDGFWFFCLECESWFHGTCVKIKPSRAPHNKHYKCPTCNNDRANVEYTVSEIEDQVQLIEKD